MSAAYKHQAFVPPTHFDMRLLAEKATARDRSVLDDVEMMQIDPEYMRHVALLWRSSKMYNRDGMQATDIWREVALGLLLALGNRICAWKDICHVSQHARDTLAHHGDQVRPGTTMPADVNFALKHFWYTVDFSLERQANAVGDLLPTLAH